MNVRVAFVLSGWLVTTAHPLLAAETIRQEPIHFSKGASSASVKDRIEGSQTVDYRLQARAGQTLSVDFEPSNPAAYFNVLPPHSDTALFIGSISGDHAETVLPADGTYTVRVYLMRSAARRNEAANYTLDVAIRGTDKAAAAGVPTGASKPAFDRSLALHGIRFHVTSTNTGPETTLGIVPAGLEFDNSPIVRKIDGSVTGAEVADLDVDRSPEIYVYVNSAGRGAYGSLIAYSANRRKSLSEIYLPPVAEDTKLGIGYRGHDEFAVVENALVQRFPIYRNGDADATPTGGMRQIQYTLKPGETGWLLAVDRVAEY